MDSVEVLDEPDIHFVDSHDGSCGAYLKMATVFGQKNKTALRFMFLVGAQGLEPWTH